MPNTISSEYTSTSDLGQDVARTVNNESRNVAQEGIDILKENPVLTLVAVGVLGFAVGALAGRSSVRRRSGLDANWDSLQRAVESARSGASDTVGSWTKTLRNELPDHIPRNIKQQVRRLLQSLPH